MQQRSDNATGRIVFLDRGTFGPLVSPAKPAFCHEWVEHMATPPGEVVCRLAGADIAIANKVPIGGEDLEGLPQLRMIAVAATGYDVIDIAACRERGIEGFEAGRPSNAVA